MIATHWGPYPLKLGGAGLVIGLNSVVPADESDAVAPVVAAGTLQGPQYSVNTMLAPFR